MLFADADGDFERLGNGGKAEEVVEVEYDAGPLEIGFNVGYLQDILGVLTTPLVKLSVSDANSSALIEGPGNDDVLYVVMPMRL